MVPIKIFLHLVRELQSALVDHRLRRRRAGTRAFRGLLIPLYLTSSILCFDTSNAAECGNHAGRPVWCRELSGKSLLGSYCFAPDNLPVKAVNKANASDVFVTPDLWGFELGNANASPQLPFACKPGRNFDQTYRASIKSQPNGLFTLSLLYEKDTVATEIVDMMPMPDTNDTVLYLQGHFKGFDYFVFLRDMMGTSAKLPKFLYVLAYDISDVLCVGSEPGPTTVSSSACVAPPPSIRAGGSFAETTIGGGGEHK